VSSQYGREGEGGGAPERRASPERDAAKSGVSARRGAAPACAADARAAGPSPGPKPSRGPAAPEDADCGRSSPANAAGRSGSYRGAPPPMPCRCSGL
jgi:hypothetical protein